MSYLSTLVPFFQIATPIVGVAAIIVAWVALKTNRQIAANKATFDFILKMQTDERMISANYACNSAIAELGLADKIGINLESNDAKIHVESIINLLNIYEFMATAAHNEVMSEKIIRAYYRTTVTRKFDKCKPVVDHIRAHSNAPNAYSAVEKLVNSWRSS